MLIFCRKKLFQGKLSFLHAPKALKNTDWGKMLISNENDKQYDLKSNNIKC